MGRPIEAEFILLDGDGKELPGCPKVKAEISMGMFSFEGPVLILAGFIGMKKYAELVKANALLWSAIQNAVSIKISPPFNEFYTVKILDIEKFALESRDQSSGHDPLKGNYPDKGWTLLFG